MKNYVAGLVVPLLLAASNARAEVVAQDDDSFVTRDTAVVATDPKATWLALISPGKWWNSAHTWSGDAANMTLRPQAGGCFCEKIPEDPTADRVTLEGSVEHMRVIQAFPEKVLRMRGGLGPLQSEPADGVLTIVLSEAEEGTRIVWEYVVGGAMRYEKAVISKAVDGVMTQQLDGLAALLGRLDKPSVAAEEQEGATGEESDAGEAPADGPEPTLEEAIDALVDD
ncbi:SRPBCC family protein [Altererythrobacter arenosus]|uniref:SRPBCC family protein n=1 Tax=Altererythrobacter arenosus TaxID=3032592 RepID=A0ABY8FNT4_9SPHN|nr:SRPBCC family protein [Altererythrobacter sp. CAU 1644]WFL76673.1 SRPBCC family protein [Altererythrobacter sp. CAU 1644]